MCHGFNNWGTDFLLEHVFNEGDNYTDVIKISFLKNSYKSFFATQCSPPIEDVECMYNFEQTKLTEMMDIWDSMLHSPRKSLQMLAQQHEIRCRTAHKAVRQTLKLFFYGIRAEHEITEADHDNRLGYFELFDDFIKNSEDIDVTFLINEACLSLRIC